MSRSVKGSKGPGAEFWTARPFNGHGANYGGRFGKKRTHKAERQEGIEQSRHFTVDYFN